MTIFLLLSFLSLTSPITGKEVVANCTEGLKSRASLKFSECYDPLLPVKWCHELYRETLDYWPRQRYDKDYVNKTHKDDFCVSRKKISSCEYLQHLTEVCGAHYDTCHSVVDKKEIMRMWIKQFVRGTHEIYWEFYFKDDNQEIINGSCNDILEQFFDSEEIPELLSLINSGPNSYKEEESYIHRLLGENVTMLVSTKISNLTQDFGTMVDTQGEPFPSKIAFGERSHWSYCEWKMKHMINDYEHLSETLYKLMRCDGKCNNQDGTLDIVRNSRLEWNGIDGICSCAIIAENNMGRGLDLGVDAAKMGLCRGFKTLLENCTIPIGECIGNIALKEIIMIEYLKKMIARADWVIQFVNDRIPDFFDKFSYEDCEIFGGEIAGSSAPSTSWMHILVSVMVTSYTFLNNSLCTKVIICNSW